MILKGDEVEIIKLATNLSGYKRMKSRVDLRKDLDDKISWIMERKLSIIVKFVLII